MIKVTYRLFVEGPNDERVTLKLIRDTKHNNLKGKFSVGECICYGYQWREESVELFMDVFLPETISDENINIEAGKKAWNAIITLNFLFGFKVINEYPFPSKITKGQYPPSLLIKSTNQNINKIHRFLGAVHKHHKPSLSKNARNLEKVYLTSMNFFVRHLDATQAELYEDSLLNIYKVFELLARDYYKFNKHLEGKIRESFKNSFIIFLEQAYNETYDKVRHTQLINLIEKTTMAETLKDSRVIVMVARTLKFDDKELTTLQEICKTRNSIAHGNTEEVDVLYKLLDDGYYLARKMLAKMILNDSSYSNSYPNLTITHYALR